MRAASTPAPIRFPGEILKQFAPHKDGLIGFYSAVVIRCRGEVWGRSETGLLPVYLDASCCAATDVVATQAVGAGGGPTPLGRAARWLRRLG